MDTNNSNKEFISNSINDAITNMQISLSQRINDLAVLGFVPSKNTYCLLSIMSLLIQAADSFIIYNNEQWNNILLLYNKVNYGRNI